MFVLITFFISLCYRLIGHLIIVNENGYLKSPSLYTLNAAIAAKMIPPMPVIKAIASSGFMIADNNAKMKTISSIVN